MLPVFFLSVAMQPIGQADKFALPWARIVLSLLMCLGLAVAAIAFLRRRSSAVSMVSFARLLARPEHGRERDLELIERLHVSPASQICLVRCGNRRILLHVSAAGAQVLTQFEDDSGTAGP